MSSNDTAPPDYTPLAEASAESNKIMADLGNKQLDFAKLQYEESKPLIDQVIANDQKVQDQTLAQGKDYYDYMVANQRPVEQALNYEAMGLTADDIAKLNEIRAQETQSYNDLLKQGAPASVTTTSQQPTYSMGWEEGAVKGSDLAKAASGASGIPEKAGLFPVKAFLGMTDQAKYEPDSYYVKGSDGTYRKAEQRITEGSKTVNSTATGSAPQFQKDTSKSDAFLAQATAAADARSQEAAAGKAAADVRQGTTRQQNQLIRQGLRYGMSPDSIAANGGAAAASAGLAEASAMNNAREQDKTMRYAKKLDVAGLYRGLPGASQGAYGVALQAGNAASANSQVAGSNYQSGMAQGANTIGSGRSLFQQGLTTIAGGQNSGYLAGENAANEKMGAGVGAVAGIAVAVI